MNNKIPEGTTKLLDDEEKEAKRRRDLISRLTLEIEAILLRELLTMGEFLEIIDGFTRRANDVFSKITIKEIKEKYERL